MCAIIFAAAAMCESCVLRFNAEAVWVGEDHDIRSSTGGLDKRYPQGPVCEVNGKTVPTFCCSSESGSITSEILVDMPRVIEYLLMCFVSSMVSTSSTDLMVSRPFSFSTVTAVALNSHKPSGMRVSGSLTEPLIGKLVILANRMGASRWP